MNQKEQGKNKFVKVFGVFWGTILILTFFSKSIYNYRLPVVTVASPVQGKISFTVEETAEVSYSHVNAVYAEVDGRVREIPVRTGEEVQKGQCIMRLEMDGTGEMKDIIAEDDGIISFIGVKKGMYVSSMQNIILYEIAEKSEEWTVAVFITEEQIDYVDMGSTATVEIPDIPERLTGEIRSIVPYADQNGAGYLAKIIISSTDMELAGRRAKVTIRKDSPQYDTLVPAEALQKDAKGYYVLVLKEDDRVLGNGYAAYRRSVDLLDADETYCAVRGLPEDEIVIVSATSEITDGSKVYYEGGNDVKA